MTITKTYDRSSDEVGALEISALGAEPGHLIYCCIVDLPDATYNPFPYGEYSVDENGDGVLTFNLSYYDGPPSTYPPATSILLPAFFHNTDEENPKVSSLVVNVEGGPNKVGTISNIKTVYKPAIPQKRGISEAPLTPPTGEARPFALQSMTIPSVYYVMALVYDDIDNKMQLVADTSVSDQLNCETSPGSGTVKNAIGYTTSAESQYNSVKGTHESPSAIDWDADKIIQL